MFVRALRCCVVVVFLGALGFCFVVFVAHLPCCRIHTINSGVVALVFVCLFVLFVSSFVYLCAIVCLVASLGVHMLICCFVVVVLLWCWCVMCCCGGVRCFVCVLSCCIDVLCFV